MIIGRRIARFDDWMTVMELFETLDELLAAWKAGRLHYVWYSVNGSEERLARITPKRWCGHDVVVMAHLAGPNGEQDGLIIDGGYLARHGGLRAWLADGAEHGKVFSFQLADATDRFLEENMPWCLT